jgi:hypothetical protein
VPGQTFTTATTATKAEVTPTPYAAWASAGAKIIHKMWMDRKPYDAMLHNQNQLKHGSWVLQLNAT